jgi:GntR family transcriptional regulator, arabinose operon transcriptional repressor
MMNQSYSQLMPPPIIMNDEHGGFIATEHSIKLGHEKIIVFLKPMTFKG